MTTAARSRLLKAIQSHVARSCVTASTMRGARSRGTLDIARAFLRAIDLRRFGTSRRWRFEIVLEHATRRLMRRLPPSARSWGLARKVLNLFLRDATYNAHLRATYRLERSEPLLEIPLDSITGSALGGDAGSRGQLRWPGVRKLTPQLSEALQAEARRRASRLGIPAVHLDAFIWAAGRDKAGPGLRAGSPRSVGPSKRSRRAR